MTNKLSNIWAVGNILVAIFIFFLSLNYYGVIKYTGLIGSTLTIISQVYYIIKKW